MATGTAKSLTKPDFDIPGVERLCEPALDRATGGRYWLGKSTLGDYLTLLKLYDPRTNQFSWDNDVSVQGLQRAVIKVETNAIKRGMWRDVLTGAILPPVTLFVDRTDGTPEIWLLDGSQRTHVMFLDAVVAQNIDHILDQYEWAQREVEKLKMQDKPLLTFEELMKQPVFIQLWSDFASPSHTVRLFLLLNAGQQKVSSRHLLEVLGRQLQGMFTKWDIPWITERTKKEGPKLVKGVRKFDYNFLLTGLVAYLRRDPHMKTDLIVGERTEAGSFDLQLEDNIQAAGDANCKNDFVWACKELNEALADAYDSDRVQNLIWSAETFFVPLMAAIGKARERDLPVDDRQRELLEFIRRSKSSDPLVFGRTLSDDEGDRKPDPKALFTIIDSLTSSIGKRTRSIVYKAFVQFFRNGVEAKSYPVDWELGRED